MKNLALIICLITSQFALGQSTFINLYNEFPNGDIFDIDEDPAGGYVISNQCIPVWGYGADAMVWKTDHEGNILWVRKFDSTFTTYGRGVALMSDGSIFTLIHFFTGPGTIYSELVKLSSVGEIQWMKKLGNDTTGLVGQYNLQALSDNSVIIATSSDFDEWGSGYHVRLTKYNINGDTVWSRVYTDDIMPYKNIDPVHMEIPGGYIIASQHMHYADTGPDTAVVTLTKLDAEGNYLSHVNFVFNALDGFIKCPGGGYYLVSTGANWDPAATTFCLSGPLNIRKLNDDLEEVWLKTYDAKQKFIVLTATLESGNLILMGMKDLAPGCADFDEINLFKFSSEGDSLGTYPIESSNPYVYRTGILTSDSHILFGGHTEFLEDEPAFIINADTLGNTENVEITGKAFYDANDNLIFDSGDIALSDLFCQIPETETYAATNEDGNFTRWIHAPGTYHVSVSDPAGYYQTSPIGDYEITIDSISQIVDTLYFAKKTDSIGFDLSIEITPLNTPNPGFVSYLSIQYQNNGVVPVDGIVLHFKHGSEYSLAYEEIPHTSYADNELTYAVGDLNGLSDENFTIGLTLQDTVPIGANVYYSAFIDSLPPDELNTANNTDSLIDLVGGSFDPNNKSVEPTDFSEFGYVDAETKSLTYTINFQNTGTDSATFINIIDTLADALNLSSLSMIAASHDYTMDFVYPNIVKWNFSDIMLPDSAINEPESHGYVKFKVDLKDGLTPGTQFFNKADIFFDYNSPVNTNQVFTTLQILSNINEVDYSNPVILYPNPAQGKIHVELVNGTTICSVRLLSIDGKSMMDFTMNQSGTIDISKLCSGIYMYTILTPEAKIQTGKIIIIQ